MSDQPPYAEYPRPGQGGYAAYGRGPGVYFEAIGEAWSLVRQDLGHWIAASLVLFVVTYAVALPFAPLYMAGLTELQRGPTADAVARTVVPYFLMIVLSFVAHSVLTAGMIGMGVRKLRGESINVGMMFEPFRHFGTMLGVCLLNALVVGVAYILCLLPSLYFYPVLFLMPTVAFLRQAGAVDSLSYTFDACKRFGLGLLALNIVLWVMVGVGLVLCIVPGLIAFAVLCVVYAIHYRAFFESDPAGIPTYPR